jgi:glucokinase
VHSLNSGEARPQGAIAVIAPGTGLGEAYLTWDGDAYRAHPSEGGHANFAAASADEARLLAYLREQRGFDYVSYETVCSGRGIPNLYAYQRDCRGLEEPGWLGERLADAADPTPGIVAAALDENVPAELVVATLDSFVSILGAEAGNLALKIAATGGVYLCGGIPPRIIPFLENGLFLDAFSRKGQLSNFLEAIPVHIILDPGTALLGAACYGLEQMRGRS